MDKVLLVRFVALTWSLSSLSLQFLFMIAEAVEAAAEDDISRPLFPRLRSESLGHFELRGDFELYQLKG